MGLVIILLIVWIIITNEQHRISKVWVFPTLVQREWLKAEQKLLLDEIVEQLDFNVVIPPRVEPKHKPNYISPNLNV